MTSAIALFLAVLLTQIGQYPGGRYPGGGIPGTGIPMPGRKSQKKAKTTPAEMDEQFVYVTGIVRLLDEKRIVVESRDSRIVTLKRTAKTKFTTKDAEDKKESELKPGDHVLVEATQDSEGFFSAGNVIFQQQGTAAERANASRPVDGVDQTSGNDRNSDDERPRLRRADSPAPVESAAAPTEAPAAAPVTKPDEPPLPAAADPDDPGPPTLRRGIPVRRASVPPPTQEIASAKLPASAPPAIEAPRPPARQPDPVLPEPAPEDPLIEKAREVAESFTETLPNYICQQFTTRFINTSHITNWQAQDVVSAEVVYENGKESYRNLAINGKAVKKQMEELSGSWSTGEFGTLLRDLFSRSTAAQFRLRRDSAFIAGTSAALYSFQVERENSHWRVQVASQVVFPAYKGSVWIDKKNGRVLRIETQARNVPSEFPLDTVETVADYEYVRIGGTQQFLLPVHSETLSCQRGTNTCSRNSIDFRNYKKYSGEATITFDK